MEKSGDYIFVFVIVEKNMLLNNAIYNMEKRTAVDV
jgi:hypothetical protein